MSSWIKGCNIRNATLVYKIDSFVESGISVRKAVKLLAEEGEKHTGAMVYSQTAVRARYLLNKGLREPHPKKVVHSEQSIQDQQPVLLPGMYLFIFKINSLLFSLGYICQLFTFSFKKTVKEDIMLEGMDQETIAEFINKLARSLKIWCISFDLNCSNYQLMSAS